MTQKDPNVGQLFGRVLRPGPLGANVEETKCHNIDFTPAIDRWKFPEFPQKILSRLDKNSWVMAKCIWLVLSNYIFYASFSWISLKMRILWPKTPKIFTKSAVSPFALFAQSQSLKLLLLLHFSIFLLEILKNSFSTIGFLNFKFSAIFRKVALKWRQIRNSKILSIK